MPRSTEPVIKSERAPIRFAKSPSQKKHEERMQRIPGKCMFEPWGNGVGTKRKTKHCEGDVVDDVCAKHRVELGLMVDRNDAARLERIARIEDELRDAGVLVARDVDEDTPSHPGALALAAVFDRANSESPAQRRRREEYAQNREARREVRRRNDAKVRGTHLANLKAHRADRAARVALELRLTRLENLDTYRNAHNARRLEDDAARGVHPKRALQLQTKPCKQGCGNDVTFKSRPPWGCASCVANEIERLIAILDPLRALDGVCPWRARVRHRSDRKKIARRTGAAIATSPTSNASNDGDAATNPVPMEA